MASEINELAKALAAFQAEVPTVDKTAENPFFKSKYAPLPEVMKVALPILSKHGLSVTQLVDHIDGQTALRTILMHTSGQSVSGMMPLKLTKDDPQAQGSAITYARRYAFMAALGLVADEDDDGNAASSQREQKKQPTAQAKTPSQTTYPASEAQKNLLLKLIKEREVPDEAALIVTEKLDANDLKKSEASTMIEEFLSYPEAEGDFDPRLDIDSPPEEKS